MNLNNISEDVTVISRRDTHPSMYRPQLHIIHRPRQTHRRRLQIHFRQGVRGRFQKLYQSLLHRAWTLWRATDFRRGRDGGRRLGTGYIIILTRLLLPFLKQLIQLRGTTVLSKSMVSAGFSLPCGGWWRLRGPGTSRWWRELHVCWHEKVGWVYWWWSWRC